MILINGNKEVDKIYLNIFDKEQFPRLYEQAITAAMNEMGYTREKAEEFINARKGWKIPIALLFDAKEFSAYAVEYEALYATSEEGYIYSPYTKEKVKVGY